MKNLILITMLFIYTITFGQKTVTVDYSTAVVEKNRNKISENDVEITIIYNYNNTRNVYFINSNGNGYLFYVIGNIEKGYTNNNEEYITINAIDSDSDKKCILQIFSDLTLRILYEENLTAITFFKKE